MLGKKLPQGSWRCVNRNDGLPYLSDRAANKHENDDDNDDAGIGDRHDDDRDGVCAWVPICREWRDPICPFLCGPVSICCVVFVLGWVPICT